MGRIYYSCAILHLLAMGFAICTCLSTNTTSFGCISGERNALLKLKASFQDPVDRLSSWHTGTDCCTWKGVVCDSNTAHVISLRLRNTHWRYYYFPDEISLYNYSLRSNHVDSSMLELKYLSYLDLSGNDFQLSPIPAFLGSMKQLHHLNLSRANFSGVVPHNLGNLSSLRVLDLNTENFEYPCLMVDDLIWAANLSMLESLDMSFVNLSRAKHLSDVLFHMLPSILHLRLFYTQLTNTHFPNSCVNSSLLTNIQHLDLSSNSFDGELPRFLHDMTSLRVLDLSYNSFDGEFPCFLHDMASLRELDLSGNAFSGSIPTSIGKLRVLRYLRLNNNHLSGEFPISLGQLSDLELIHIESNYFNGTLSELHFAKLSKLEELRADSNLSVEFDWVPPFQLKELFLRDCTIGDGQFPQWLRTQKALETLSLGNCSISGSLPEWLHYLNLTYIDLSDNMINGSIPKLPPNLEFLYLSHNLITGSIPKLPPYMKQLYLSQNHIVGPIPTLGSSLKRLILSDNMMDGSIPDSLCKLKDLSILGLSKNRFSGHIPYCLAALQNLMLLSLSSNELSGVIPNSIGEARRLKCLSLRNNSLTGPLPSTMKNCTSLDFLDVGENMLSGNLPDWIGTHLPNLGFLILRKNEFNGLIPSTFCRLFHLQVMDLSNNKLTGNISHCFGNLLSMVEEDDYMRLPSLFQLVFGEALNQVMKGMELEYTSTLHYLVKLDLSSNNLAGEIPLELTNLSGLNGLNLSHNRLLGEIPTNIGDLKRLESLDLSINNLHGAIPGSLSDVDSLGYLNLSHNHLSGPIPTGRHFQTLEDPSIYASNPGLCGAPLPKKCHDDGSSKSPKVDENDGAVDEDDRNDKIIFYGIIASGFATGFWGIIGALVLRRSWGLAFSQFAEVAISKILGL